MPEAIVSVAGMAANSGILSFSVRIEICPHCGEDVPVKPSRWDFSRRAGKLYPCPACSDDMHAAPDGQDVLSEPDLSETERIILQAVQENQPVKHETLAIKAGVNPSTLTRCLPRLKKLPGFSQVKGAGYTYKTCT